MKLVTDENTAYAQMALQINGQLLANNSNNGKEVGNFKISNQKYLWFKILN